MQRRSLLRLAALAPVVLFRARYLKAMQPAGNWLVEQRERAEQLDSLATNIHTPADARLLVDFIADQFAKEIPSAWRSGSLRNQIAQAEFSAVSGSNRLIPEIRIADAWNTYAETLQAPANCKVTANEIHYLRDALLTSTRQGGASEIKTIWTVSSIYSTQADSSIARGCRAIEAIRVLWDLANHQPDNLTLARDGISRGILYSASFRQSQMQSHPATTERRMVAGRAYADPMQTAQWEYARKNGAKAFHKAVLAMLDTIMA